MTAKFKKDGITVPANGPDAVLSNEEYDALKIKAARADTFEQWFNDAARRASLYQEEVIALRMALLGQSQFFLFMMKSSARQDDENSF